MATIRSQILGFVVVLAPLLVSSIHGEFVCPPATSIEPCACDPEGNRPDTEGSIWCNTPDVTQYHISNLVNMVRAVNNASTSDKWLTIDLVAIVGTSLTTLDLRDFTKLDIRDLGLYSNIYLSSIVGGTESTDEEEVDPFRFVAVNIDLGHSFSLGDRAFSTLFKFIVPQKVEDIYIDLSLLQGSIIDLEHPGFVPYWSEFTSLRRLDLSSNNVAQVSGGQFRNNTKLTNIDLRQNTIRELGEGAFLFNSDPDMKDTFLEIRLTTNFIYTDMIQPNHGLESIGRPLRLYLDYNNLQYLPQNSWESFLRADDRNEFFGEGNQFVCDERMKWLKDGREMYESRVHGIYCTNDPGHTIFTTDLV